MIKHIRPAVVVFIALTLATGVLYPMLVTLFAQTIFESRANGSMIVDPDGKVVGSMSIGQEFGTSDPAAAPGLAKWFWGRPSATSPVPYTALSENRASGSSGSNLSLSNPAFADHVRARIDAIHAAERSVGIASEGTPVPVDLVTMSASGLDPHISRRGAEYQALRVARARGLDPERVHELIERCTIVPPPGISGEPVVHVLLLNRAIERAEISSKPPPAAR